MRSSHIAKLTLGLLVKASAVTLVEGQEHDSSEDCWSVIYGKVYDLTQYGQSHFKEEDQIVSGPSVVGRYMATTKTILKSVVSNLLEICKWINITANAGAYNTGNNVSAGPDKIRASRDSASSPLEETTNPTQPPVDSPSIRFEELTMHNSPEDCWVAYYGVVYDMTGYAYIHPGPGESAIHPWCGNNGTNAFQFYHDESLLALVENEKIGNLGTSSASRVKCIPSVAVYVLAILFVV